VFFKNTLTWGRRKKKTLTYHSGKYKKKKVTSHSVHEAVRKKALLNTAGRNANFTPFWRKIWQYLTKLQVGSPEDTLPAIENTRLFTAVFFKIVSQEIIYKASTM
jgi:deoxyribodipyrimidine photolyase